MAERERDSDPVKRGDFDDDVEAKLKTIRDAARHEYPTGDIETMLAEIERGRWTKSH
jgi:hypothetical protein